MNGQGDRPDGEMEIYFRELRQWLEETRQWHLHSLERNSGYLEYLRQHDLRPRINRRHQVRHPPQQAQPPAEPEPVPQPQPQREPMPQPQQPARVYKQYKIPPLWRRFIAELLDFFILLSIKLFLIVLAFEIANSLHIEKYWSKVDQHQIAIHLTILEVLQACLSLFYETMFLSSTLSATPGKRYMGLQVLYVEHIITPPPYLDGTIVCYPATRLSVGRSLMRSVTKHVLCAFLLPVFYSFLTLGFNRTRYDLYANTVVVEYDPNPALQIYQ